jgi:hypothetical protein
VTALTTSAYDKRTDRVIAASTDPLFTLADQTILSMIPPHIRRDAVVMLATALWLGEVKSEDVGQAAKILCAQRGKRRASIRALSCWMRPRS